MPKRSARFLACLFALLALTACEQSDSIVGELETVELDPAGFVSLSGWAVDQSDTSTNLDIWVSEAWVSEVDGELKGSWHLLGPTDSLRSDLESVDGVGQFTTGEEVGFSAGVIPTETGTRQYCVRAVNTPAQEYHELGCRNVSIPAASLGGLGGQGLNLSPVDASGFRPECANERAGMSLRAQQTGPSLSDDYFATSPASVPLDVPSGHEIRADVNWVFEGDRPTVGTQIVDFRTQLTNRQTGVSSRLFGGPTYSWSSRSGEQTNDSFSVYPGQHESGFGTLDISFPSAQVVMYTPSRVEGMLILTVVNSDDGSPLCAPDCADAGGDVYFAEDILISGEVYSGCYSGDDPCDSRFVNTLDRIISIALLAQKLTTVIVGRGDFRERVTLEAINTIRNGATGQDSPPVMVEELVRDSTKTLCVVGRGGFVRD